jgi:3-methyladenine DNA glycosylase AlkC
VCTRTRVLAAESRPLTSAYIARVRVDRPMDTIEARRVKNIPGNLQVMRLAEEGTANQCPITKESTGAPVSVTEQDSHKIGYLTDFKPSLFTLPR